jgi:hypothetical protein
MPYQSPTYCRHCRKNLPHVQPIQDCCLHPNQASEPSKGYKLISISMDRSHAFIYREQLISLTEAQLVVIDNQQFSTKLSTKEQVSNDWGELSAKQRKLKMKLKWSQWFPSETLTQMSWPTKCPANFREANCRICNVMTRKPSRTDQTTSKILF